MENCPRNNDIYRFPIQGLDDSKTSVSMDGLMARQLIKRFGSIENTKIWVCSVAKKHLIEKAAGLHAESLELGVSRYVQRVALIQLLNITEFAMQDVTGQI